MRSPLLIQKEFDELDEDVCMMRLSSLLAGWWTGGVGCTCLKEKIKKAMKKDMNLYCALPYNIIICINIYILHNDIFLRNKKHRKWRNVQFKIGICM